MCVFECRLWLVSACGRVCCGWVCSCVCVCVFVFACMCMCVTTASASDIVSRATHTQVEEAWCRRQRSRTHRVSMLMKTKRQTGATTHMYIDPHMSSESVTTTNAKHTNTHPTTHTTPTHYIHTLYTHTTQHKHKQKKKPLHTHSHTTEQRKRTQKHTHHTHTNQLSLYQPPNYPHKM